MQGHEPLLITHADGERSILLLKDVECNPLFKMTLISVRLLAEKGATLIFGEVCWIKLLATVKSPTPKLVDIRLTSSGLFTFDAALLTGFAGQFPPAPVYALAATQLNPTEAAIVGRLDV